MTLYRTRTPAEREIIVNNLTTPYVVENFLSSDDIGELIEIYDHRQNKIQKHTGPVTSELRDDFDSIPVLKSIKEKILAEVGECEIYTGFYFNVIQPHIIHNDDDKQGPVVYKAFTLPLKIEMLDDVEPKYPSLCFFDQYYLEGPSKFFKGATVNIKEYYNTIVYDYKDVHNLSNTPFDVNVYQEYLSHLKLSWLDGLSFNSAHTWKPGNAIVFDCVRLHAASNFTKQGIKSKLGISIFTQLP
jgi:hypothetical protein